MRFIKWITQELLGLFVDDGAFAGVIIGWIVLIFVVHRFIAASRPLSVALFIGLAVLLVVQLRRQVRRLS